MSRHLRNLCLKYEANNSIHLLFMHVPTQHKLSTHPDLSPRENEIMCLLFLGMSSIDIATGLDICVVTVRKHRENILWKLKVNSLRKAAILFIMNK